MGDQNFWSIFASIATIIGVGVVICAALLALRQLRETTRARHLEAMLRVYEMIGSEDARSSRRFIYTQLKSNPEKITPQEQEKIEEVTVALDRIGTLVSANLVPKKLLFSSHCEMVILCWDKLSPYIMYRRLHLDDPTYATYFERLAGSARDYKTINSREPLKPGIGPGEVTPKGATSGAGG